MHITGLNETVLLIIKFSLGGTLRFLSHAEMLRVFQRACVRAGFNIQYSQGFNPRPKMSLPLPRPVGVESDEELLCLRICKELRVRQSDADKLCHFVRDKLSAQLPEGCVLSSISIAQTGTSFQPCSATYVLAVRPEYLNEDLTARIELLLASESLSVRRQTGKKNAKPKNVDVRDFLKSIKADDRSIIVECNISPAGSIRIDEILGLLELDTGKLALPIRRINVQWKVD